MRLWNIFYMILSGVTMFYGQFSIENLLI
jgi:hypothetical protein